MILTLQVIKNNFMGNSYYFNGYTQGKLRNGNLEIEKDRIHFYGDTVLNCLDKAFEFSKSLDSISSKVKLDILLKELREEI